MFYKLVLNKYILLNIYIHIFNINVINIEHIYVPVYFLCPSQSCCTVSMASRLHIQSLDCLYQN